MKYHKKHVWPCLKLTGCQFIHLLCQLSQQNVKNQYLHDHWQIIAQQAWKLAQTCLRVFPTMLSQWSHHIIDFVRSSTQNHFDMCHTLSQSRQNTHLYNGHLFTTSPVCIIRFSTIFVAFNHLSPILHHFTPHHLCHSNIHDDDERVED